MARYDVIVLGCGGVGSAALYHLARRGVRALGIDRFTPPHDRGSTHGHTRVIRQAYFEHPDYVPLLKRAYFLWHELETTTKRRLFNQIGLVEIGPHDGLVVPGVVRAAAEHGLEVETLDPADVARRWPGLQCSDGLAAVFEPAAGYLYVEECVRAHVEAARNLGAELLTDTEVRSWFSDERGVTVQLSDGQELVADRLIIAAGAWASRMLRDVNVRLTVLRKSLFWFATDDVRYDLARGMPVFLFEMPPLNGSHPDVFYGFPKLDARGVKFAEHSGGQIVADPITVDRSIDAVEQRRVLEVLAQHLPGVSPHVTDHAVCLYTMSPDEHFIVDRHPLHQNVVFAAGLSGHGFKFVPVLGQALTQLVLDSATDLPIEFLSLKRFTAPAP
jgi:sarcosine oxidase